MKTSHLKQNCSYLNFCENDNILIDLTKLIIHKVFPFGIHLKVLLLVKNKTHLGKIDYIFSTGFLKKYF